MGGSSIHFKGENPSQITTPALLNRAKLFFNEITNSLCVRKGNGTLVDLETGGSGDGIEYLEEVSVATTGGSTREVIYTFTPVTVAPLTNGKRYILKITTSNIYEHIKIDLTGIGTNSLLKFSQRNYLGRLEIKAGSLLEVGYLNGNFYLLSGLDPNEVVETSISELKTSLIPNNLLVVGRYYQFIFSTQYTYGGALTTSPNSEILIVRADSTNSLSPQAKSLGYPNDVILYDINHSSHSNGKILYRENPVKNLIAGYDWRNVKFKRGEDPITGYNIIADPDDSNFNTNPLAIYTFDNAQDGGTCRNILLENLIDENSLAVLAGDIEDNNVVDGNNTFQFCRNLHVERSYYNSFYTEAPVSGNDPAYGNQIKVSETKFSIFINCGLSEIKRCTRTLIYGEINGSGIGSYSLRNLLLTDLNLCTLYAPLFNSTIENSKSSVFRDISGSYFVGADNSIFNKIINSRLEHSVNTDFYSINDSHTRHLDKSSIQACTKLRGSHIKNLNLYDSTDAQIDGLESPEQIPEWEGQATSSSLAGPTETVVILSLGITIGDPEIIKIDDSVGPFITFAKPLQIAFDTDGDGSADTAYYDVEYAGQTTNWPTPSTTYFLQFDGTKFRLMNYETGRNSYRLSQNNIIFDKLRSNIEDVLEYDNSDSSISLSGIGFNLNHVGEIKLELTVDANIELMKDSNPLYPELIRRISTNALGFNITIGGTAYLSASNDQIILATSSPLVLDGDKEDYFTFRRSKLTGKILQVDAMTFF